MTITTILLGVFGAMLFAAYALGVRRRSFAGDFGRAVIRTITFGRIRIESDADEIRAMAVNPLDALCCNAATDFHLRSHHRFTRALMSCGPDKILSGRLGKKVRVACLGHAQVFLGFRKVGMET